MAYNSRAVELVPTISGGRGSDHVWDLAPTTCVTPTPVSDASCRCRMAESLLGGRRLAHTRAHGNLAHGRSRVSLPGALRRHHSSSALASHPGSGSLPPMADASHP